MKNGPILVPQCGPIWAPVPPPFGNEYYSGPAMRSHFGPAMRSHFGLAKRPEWVRFWVLCRGVFGVVFGLFLGVLFGSFSVCFLGSFSVLNF